MTMLNSESLLSQSPLKRGLLHFPVSQDSNTACLKLLFVLYTPAALASSTKIISLSRTAGDVCRTL